MEPDAVLIELLAVAGCAVAWMVAGPKLRRRVRLDGFKREVNATRDLRVVDLEGGSGFGVARRDGSVLAVANVDHRRRWHLVVHAPRITPRRAVVITRRGRLRGEDASGMSEIDSGDERIDAVYQFNGHLDVVQGLFRNSHARDAIDAYFSDDRVLSIVCKDASITSAAELELLTAVEVRDRIARLEALSDVLAPLIPKLALTTTPTPVAPATSTPSGDPFPIPLFRR